MRRTAIIFAALVAVTVYSPARAVEPGDATPAATAEPDGRRFLSKRIARAFDFEERQLGNFERMPRNWFVYTGAGFPKHTADLAGFDRTHARSGEHALMLKVNGGSAAAALERGAIPAIAGGDYVVVAHCRTEQLKLARARLVVCFIDQHQRVIKDSVAASPLHVGNGKWTRLEARLRGDFEQAAWIIVRVELLQPEVFRDAVLGQHELFQQDIGGAAWFDDITVYQLPRVEIGAQNDTHVVRGDRPALSLTVRDLTSEPLSVRAVVRDHLGRVVDEQARTLDGRHTSQWTWRPGLGKFGWYWADLAVRSGDRMVGRRSCAFAWLPPSRGKPPLEHERFGVVAEGLSNDQRALLVKMLPTIGSGAVIVDLWRAEMTDDELGRLHDEFDPTITALIGLSQRVTLSINEVPAPLAEAARVDQDSPLALFAGDPAQWQPYLRSAAARYGQRITHWQIGGVGSDEPSTRVGFADEYSTLRDWLGQLVPDAKVAVPWSALTRIDRAAQRTDALTIRVPVSVRPDRIPAYAMSWPTGSKQSPAMAMALETLPLDQFDHQRRGADLLLRLVHAWAVQPSSVFIDRPWRAQPGHRDAATPDPLLAVYANAIERLGGRRVVGELPIGDGLRCLILDTPGSLGDRDADNAEDADDARGGALVAWNERSTDASPRVSLQMGNQPVAVDMWGNRTPLAERDGRHVLNLSSEPVFVEGIDATLARLRAGLRFEPAFVETSARMHRLQLRITNPWPHPVAGRLRLFADEEGWAFQPGLLRLNLGAGQTMVMPLELTMPISSYAGYKQVRGQLELDTGMRYQVEVNIPLEVGLKDVEYRSSLRLENGRAIVTATITNRGERAAGYYAFARAPQRAMKQRIVARLQPGETTTKRFTFDNAAELSGEYLRVGLRQLEGSGVLTQRLDVP